MKVGFYENFRETFSGPEILGLYAVEMSFENLHMIHIYFLSENESILKGKMINFTIFNHF